MHIEPNVWTACVFLWFCLLGKPNGNKSDENPECMSWNKNGSMLSIIYSNIFLANFRITSHDPIPTGVATLGGQSTPSTTYASVRVVCCFRSNWVWPHLWDNKMCHTYTELLFKLLVIYDVRDRQNLNNHGDRGEFIESLVACVTYFGLGGFLWKCNFCFSILFMSFIQKHSHKFFASLDPLWPCV